MMAFLDAFYDRACMKKAARRLLHPVSAFLFHPRLVFLLVLITGLPSSRATQELVSDASLNRLEEEDQPNTDPMWIHRLIFASLNGLLFLLGLANVLVLFIVGRYRRMRTVTNILIFNLCMADLIYISFLPVVIMFQLLRDWMFGIVACKLFYITESTAKYASVYFVGILSLDRYFALCHPQICKRYRRPSLAFLVSAVGWCVTAVLMMPIYLYSTVIRMEGGRSCTVAWPNGASSSWGQIDADYYNEQLWNESTMLENQTCYHFEDQCTDENGTVEDTWPPYFGGPPPTAQLYFIALTFVFCFGLPAFFILFFYFKVLVQLFQASDRAERLKKKREKTYRKVTRMVLAVVSFYLICWLPYWTQFLLVTFVQFPLNDALKIFFNCIHLLPYLNCAMNPILYSLMTDNFRKILSELFPVSGCLRLRRIENTKSTNAQAIGLLEKKSDRHRNHLDADDALHANGDSRFLSIGSSMSHSIRMMSDFSVNLMHSRHASVVDLDSNSVT